VLIGALNTFRSSFQTRADAQGRRWALSLRLVSNSTRMSRHPGSRAGVTS